MKISIITITYNSAETLESTIKSVIEQGYEDLEYIIIDGISTDGTLDIINKYRNSISYFVSEKDNGISDAFNKGIKAATGDIIGIINSDDMLYTDALKKVNSFFESNPDTEVLHANTLRFTDENGKGYVVKPDTDLDKMKYTFLLNHPSVFVRAEAYEKHGVFSVDYKYAMDYELLSKMYFNDVSFGYLDEILSCFREGGVSIQCFEKTCIEHRRIAIRNGASENEIDKYLKKIKMNLKIKEILKKLKLIQPLRKILKKQEYLPVINKP